MSINYQLRPFWPITNFFKLPITKLLCCYSPFINRVFSVIGILSLGALLTFATSLSFYFVKRFSEMLSLVLPVSFLIDLNSLINSLSSKASF